MGEEKAMALDCATLGVTMRESDVEQYLIKRVQAIGGEVRKVQWVGRRHAPDRLVMWKAAPFVGLVQTAIWVELKAPGQKPRAGQEREHERMRAMGQRVEVVDSLEAVDKLLSQESL